MNESIFLVSQRIITLFLILFAGVYARKINILDQASTSKLSALLLNVTQPLMIIASFQMEFNADKLREGAWLFVTSAVVHTATAVLALLFFMPIKDFEQRKVYKMCAVFSNIGFLGFPVLSVVFEDGIFYGVFYTMFFNIFIWTYGVYLISKKNTSADSIKFPLRKIFLNAGMISSVIGIILFVLRINIPAMLYDSMVLVGDMTFPLAMIIIGSLVCDINLREVFTDKKNYYFMFIKLFAMPVIFLFAGRLLGLPRLYIYMAALMSAMPSAAMAAMFAETYESDAKSATANVGLSTLFSIASIPLIIWLIELVV